MGMGVGVGMDMGVGGCFGGSVGGEGGGASRHLDRLHALRMVREYLAGAAPYPLPSPLPSHSYHADTHPHANTSNSAGSSILAAELHARASLWAAGTAVVTIANGAGALS